MCLYLLGIGIISSNKDMTSKRKKVTWFGLKRICQLPGLMSVTWFGPKKKTTGMMFFSSPEKC